jgi:hypothetical protein
VLGLADVSCVKRLRGLSRRTQLGWNSGDARVVCRTVVLVRRRRGIRADLRERALVLPEIEQCDR